MLIDDRLKFILENVNGWLKFNETKNAALLTMSIALIVCCVNLLKDIDKIVPYHYLVWYFIAVLMVVMFRSLWTLIARMDNHIYDIGICKDEVKNVLYYGHIAKMNEDCFLNMLYSKYDSESKPLFFSNYQRDLANQIIINSRIALEKATSFNCSVKILFWMLLLGLVIFAFLA